MNIRIVLFVLGKLAQACGLALMIPFVIALFYGETSIAAFLVAIVISLLIGRLLMWQGHRPTDSLTVREGVAITASLNVFPVCPARGRRSSTTSKPCRPAWSSGGP